VYNRSVGGLLVLTIENTTHMWYYELTGFCGIRNYLLMHIRYFSSVITHITNGNKNEGRLVNVMGGVVLETESDKLRREGRTTERTKTVTNMINNYIPDDPTVIKHVDEVLKLLSVMTGDNKYEIDIDNADIGGVSMCTVAQNLENIGIQKGKIEGKKEGENKQ
jgi:hypothetical protein